MEVTVEHGAADVVVGLVRTGDPRRARTHEAVGDDQHDAGEVRADVTLGELGMPFEVFVVEESRSARRDGLLEQVRIDLPVAGDQRETHLAVDVECDRLQQLTGRDTELGGDSIDAGQIGGVHLLHGGDVARRRDASVGRCAARRHLRVGGVVAALAPDERVLAHGGDRHELVVHVPAHLARLTLDGTEGEAAPGEHARVRVEHLPVAPLQAFLVGVERVRVLHQELPAAQDPESRTQLVAVLPVDLVQVHRQVAVAAVLVGGRDRDHFLGGRRQGEAGLLAVGELEHERPVGLVPPRPLPQLEGLDDRQQQLLGAGGVHLLPHDLLHLAQHPVAEGQPGVDAGRHLADEAGPHQQPVAVDLGVGRVVPEGPQEEL